jgi:hypothetical protein
MEITDEIIRKSVAGVLFGNAEPFITGDAQAVGTFYDRALGALKGRHPITVFRELDHHGSGYASYVSAFLYPSDGRSRTVHSSWIETTGILLYLSRLAPIAVFGASARGESKDNKSSSWGFIEARNLNTLPEGDWREFLRDVEEVLARYGIEVLPREPLLLPAPEDVSIPTVFDGPYFVFDTLFYWCD